MSSPATLSGAPALEAPIAPGPRARLAWKILRARGWRVTLAAPVPPKAVVVFYPHTSNWDFPIGLAVKWVTGINFRWVGKDSMFKTPLAPWFRRWGGIPVNRRESTGFVGQMLAALHAHDDFVLAIAPEGTRSAVSHWKSGFWHLARAAGVPIGLAYIDYPHREIGVGAWLDTTADPDADVARMAAFYARFTGRHPANAVPVVLKERD